MKLVQKNDKKVVDDEEQEARNQAHGFLWHKLALTLILCGR